MAFQDSSPDMLTRLIVNKTIKNELCTGLNYYITVGKYLNIMAFN